MHPTTGPQARVSAAREGSRRPRVAAAVALAVVAAAVVAAGTLVALTGPRPAAHAAPPASPRPREPAATTVLGGTPAAASAALAASLLSRAPVVAVASPAQAAAAAGAARRAHAPLLLGPVTASLQARLRALHPATVLADGLPPAPLRAALPGTRVVTTAAGLPATRPAAAPLHDVAVLLAGPAAPELSAAAAATAQAAGAQVVTLTGTDPRADPAAISALAAARPGKVVGVGAGLGAPSVLAARVAVAETGTQLPGGGQVLFPGRTVVALYGVPGTPALGVLGQQGLDASISRARATAAQYADLVHGPAVPAFEIIATVAQGSPGQDGMYSAAASVASLQPWVQAAAKAGLYVILDLQPGRASLLTQAKMYQSLLALPGVGLALDPEWKLQPGQVPLQQIGSVSVTEVNSVAAWLAGLTASHHLPQKLLELHEFRPSMITGLSQLDTSHDDLSIVVNMDGQGAPGTKQQTWDTVVSGAPPGVDFGWKDFYVKDTPMLAPGPTMAHTPTPVLISYE